MSVASISSGRLLESFEDGSIRPEHFDHRTHVEVAWTYLGQLPVLEAASRVAAGLKRLTAALGASDKYHETLTVFFVILIAERRGQRPTRSFDDFCQENPDLLADAASLVDRHYSRERLGSALARRQFLLPDPRVD